MSTVLSVDIFLIPLTMKYIVITGASKGIGKALALSFLNHEKCGLALTYNSDPMGVTEVANILSEAGFYVITIKLDISSYDQCVSAFDYIYKCFPRIDALINNAGISLVKSFYDTTVTNWNRIIDVNLNGAFNTTKQVIDRMNADGGVIFNITSMWGELGASCEVAYSASKAALIGFTKALAKEYDISVKAISVGFCNTEMNSHMTDDDIKTFLEENPYVELREPQYVGEAIRDALFDEFDKVSGGYYLKNNKNEDVIVRIW